MSSQSLTTVGLVMDIAGAWLVAIEVVNQYKGKQYKEPMPGYGRPIVTEPTEEYKKWEKLKYKWMWAGLFLLTGGFLLQALAVWY